MKNLFISICLVVLASQALAFEKIPYSQAAFNQAQAAGEVVLIDVYADWCPTCERQQLIIDAYFEEVPNSQVKVMVIDFDKDKDSVKLYKAPRQSTLYIYKNGEQKYFSVAETRRRKIHQAMRAVDPALNASHVSK